MVGMSTSDVVAPSAELVHARLAEAIAVKQQMAEGAFAAQAVEVARADDHVPAVRRKGDLFRQRRISAGRRASGR